MTELPNASGPGPIRPTGPAPRPAAKPDASGTGTPAFQVLLERLQAKAGELQELEARVGGAAELADAVDSARSSLEDALSLSEQLLEAFRAARRGSPDGPGTEPPRGAR
jgi:hypothetical protein